MSIGHSASDLDHSDAAPLRALAAARDAVLRGLVHALSNRVGTVAAVAGMLDPQAPAAGVAATVLQGETERLEQLLEEFRRLSLEPASAPEPVHLPDLLAGVVALHAHHPALRDVPCAVEGADDLPPVLAEPAAAADALLAALDAAKGAAIALGGGVRLVGTVDGATVQIRVEAAEAPDDAATSRWPLPGGAGEGWLGARGGGVALPTLAGARGG
ncbi:hypothetical protein [Roseisolibacter agri]|uniref:Uncharacterized protein n=1 Tax=Roseisolibacter agri TaxID=2014610 RepID=A0AA37Q971_9BACT|nr:hypothetical protein [Roseisolibacter agri]GLC25396.1 hypothetical protein rosag_19090 [Roseisolibacter agri]